MNKLQQEIIEIIEPYMDKTSWRGCIVVCKWEIYAWPWNWTDCFNDTYSLMEMITDDKSDCWHLLWEFWECWEYWNYLEDTKFKMFHFQADIEDWFPYLDVEDLWEIVQVFWHYDITAVLKYIKSFDWIMCYCFDDWNKFQIYKLADVNQDFWYYYIPNKPLHIYTEQENTLLLELLKKLWTN